MKKMNLPNRLTLIRIIVIPIIMVVIMLPLGDAMWQSVVSATLFLLATLTDALDGAIARKSNCVTNFGKFLDPLADKFLVFGTLLAMIANDRYAKIRFILILAVAIMLFRDLAVTSMRLVATKQDGTVIAANLLGKIKTVFQIVCVMVILLLNGLLPDGSWLQSSYFIEYICVIIMVLLTIISGYSYFKKYYSYIDPTK